MRKSATVKFAKDDSAAAPLPFSFLSFCWSNLPMRDRAKVMATQPRTVWLFGAGASCHYNLNPYGVQIPLANGFFEAFHSLPTSQGFHAHVGPFISFLAHYKGVPADKVSQWTENIEDFMTSIEHVIDQIRKRRKRAKGHLTKKQYFKAISYAMAFNNMMFILANVINEAQNGPSESLYRYLLHFCSPNDAFISLNWDTLLDRALVDTGGWNPNDGYGLRFASVLDGTWKAAAEGERAFSTDWKLLKLHGSTNWLVPHAHVDFRDFSYVSSVPKSDSIFLYWQSALPYSTHKSRWTGGYAPTCYCYYPPHIPAPLFSKKQLAAPPGKVFVKFAQKGVFAPFDEPDPNGVPSSPLLITPVRQKKYDMYESTINALWRQAGELLRNAEKIVLIGYSFPRTDTRVPELLRRSLSQTPKKISVELVDPNASDIISRIGKRTLAKAKNVTPYDMKFDDYIESVLVRRIPELTMRAASEHPEFAKWMQMIYALNQASGYLQKRSF